MICVALVLMVLVNIGILKLFWESVERNWEFSMYVIENTGSVEHIIEEWTLHQKSFYVLVTLDVIIYVAVLIGVCAFFTWNLVRHIKKPLDALDAGVQRIKNHELTTDIEYCGDEEFEEICDTFNQMQSQILKEQETNQKYEIAKTQMISGISHDLRTPLTAVRGTIKGLIDGVVTEPEMQVKFLKTAYRRTGDMDILLNQLFYISKLETGNMPMQLQQVDIAAFLKSYVKGKTEYLEQENIEMMLMTEDTVRPVSADLEQLQRVLDNLLENSRKYAEVSPLKITLNLSDTDTGVCLRFADNGIGVPENLLSKIFEEFYRTDESRNKKNGNGLGLYIVKCLTEAMGGHVCAKNENGLAVYMIFKPQQDA